MRNLFRDLRYAVRMLLKNPGFTAVAVLTLALGIGANTAIFSIVNGLLLHPSGIAHPEKLVAVRVRYEKLNLKSISISAPDFVHVRDNTRTFAAAALQEQKDFNYNTGSWPLRLRGATVTSQWFNVFEAQPILGRVFTPEEDQPANNHVVVLSYNSWRNVFGSDTSVIGRTVEFNRQLYKVIGVMGPDFQWPSQTDLWAPLGLPADAFSVGNTFNESYFAVARLQPGATFSNAASFLNLASQRVSDDPATEGYPKASGWSIFAVPFTQFVYGDVRTPLFILLGAVVLVLLIACSNVAGLLLARASGRMKEFAIRTALGGSAWRLVRQMLTESALLALVGMTLGLALAALAIRALVWLAPENLSNGLNIHLDAYVLVFSALIAGASAIIFGAAPAWQIAFTDPQQNLKQGRGAGEGSRVRHRFRSSLVIAELALALVLLAGAGVFVKSLSNLKDVNVGFRPGGLMTAALTLPENQYATPEKQVAFFSSALERLANSPGVQAAAAVVPLPFSGFDGSASFAIEGRVSPPGDPGPHGDIRQASPQYFQVMGIRLVRGRFFTPQDRLGTQPVAIIDENLARDYWPNQDPIGQHIRNGRKAPWKTIVGIVGPVRHSQVVGDESSGNASQAASKGVYYYPLYQEATRPHFSSRADSGDPIRTRRCHPRRGSRRRPQPACLRSEMYGPAHHSVDGPSPLRRRVPQRFRRHGSHASRSRPIRPASLQRSATHPGNRRAHGSRRSHAMCCAWCSGKPRLVLLGVAAGLVAAFAFTRVLSSLLYGVAPPTRSCSPPSPWSYLVSLLASWLPAHRATRVDPMVALRYE